MRSFGGWDYVKSYDDEEWEYVFCYLGFEIENAGDEEIFFDWHWLLLIFLPFFNLKIFENLLIVVWFPGVIFLEFWGDLLPLKIAITLVFYIGWDIN